ncbi:hypothetical protein [Paractinoplanes lichenicola]|uniref:Uncharacterized protein n=1 Tax=Paractinoplanes lichenicola TaxID=2802976 RepID=A0ABS1VN12_9ACTN|nr:hypothetical protein [Actinoplanes lichenicola]MBL7256127.1 hypothetical protein [Actinoplanes lichenicola]
MRLVTDLFDPEPVRWGLRGDPWVWRAMCEQLTGLALPPSVGEVERLLIATFDRVARCDLATETAPWVFREEFAHGAGMSDGSVHLEMWRAELLPTLVDRARSRLDG